MLKENCGYTKEVVCVAAYLNRTKLYFPFSEVRIAAAFCC